ncbi:hypothetical protein [Rhizobium leguminosarum]|uniref:hypothetical protein n=1 Tax=Rhizobium leguminosarum TaxID=384 RepID=UPI003F999A56
MSFKIAAKRSATCGINAAPYGRSADALDYCRAAPSENTMRAYRSDWEDFRWDSGKRKNGAISLSCHARMNFFIGAIGPYNNLQSHRNAKFE